MPEGANSRSIDERLDALTMNLELQIRDTETLRETVREGFDRVTRSISSLTEDVASLRESTAALLSTAIAHEKRLERLERRAG